MGRLGCEASFAIAASIDDRWAIVGDGGSAADWQRGLEEMNPLEHDDEGGVVHAESVSDANVKTVKSLVAFTYEPPHRLSWRQEKGDLKSVVGSWELEKLGDGVVRVTYALE